MMHAIIKFNENSHYTVHIYNLGLKHEAHFLYSLFTI